MTSIGSTRPADRDPPYGWVVVCISALMLAAGVGGMTTAISVFFEPLMIEFAWERGPVSSIYSAGIVGLALGGVLMGRIADRAGARVVCLIGIAALGLCLLLAAGLSTLWHFQVLAFVAGSLGSGSLFGPLLANVGHWFRRNVGLAIGIVSAGQALGQGAVPYVAARLIETVGWRGALTAMGALLLAAFLPLGLLLRRAPTTESGAETTAASGAQTANAARLPLSPAVAVTWLSAAALFCCTCMSVPLVHLVPLIQDRGVPADAAAGVLFLMLLAGVAGRLAFGKLADVIGPVRTYLCASAWQTLMVYFFVQVESFERLQLFAVVYGFGFAGVMTAIAVCVTALTPAARRATSLGVVILFAWMGHAIGGYQAGALFDLTGNYSAAFASAALAGAVNLAILAALHFTISGREAAGVVARG